MNKKFYLTIFALLLFLPNCSFDSKTGIWDSDSKEKKRISDLQKKQSENISIKKIFSSENIFSDEVSLNKKIILLPAKKNTTWFTSYQNNENSLGNIYLPSVDNLFMKKRFGRDKFSFFKSKISPIVHSNNIIFADDNGTIFSVNKIGKINWKQNIYTKIHKKIYRNLTISIFDNKIYVGDNIGFIYSIDIITGNLIWIKNHGIPFKSKIKIFEGKIFLINQDNRLICFNAVDGSIVWDLRSISSFIKTQNFLSLAISPSGDLVASFTSGDLIKINSKNGNVQWSLNALQSTLKHATDFFKSSEVVLNNNNIFFSTQSSTFSFNLDNGFINWEQKVSSISAPIINGENIFLVTENGYFVILDTSNGKIISSTNILKILKKKKRLTNISGFIMGSGKIYAVTTNGYLIICSATSGKAETYKKVGDKIYSNPIISDGKLFIYTDKSKIFGFN